MVGWTDVKRLWGWLLGYWWNVPGRRASEEEVLKLYKSKAQVKLDYYL